MNDPRLIPKDQWDAMSPSQKLSAFHETFGTLEDRLAFAKRMDEFALVFFAAGAPKPKGSHKAFVIAGRARIAPASAGERGWREVVSAAARDAMVRASVAPLECAVDVLMEFFEQRPKGHFRTNGQLKANAQARPTKAPDWDKLARSVGDALNGVCWRDDSQVCEGRIRKLYTTAAQPYVGVRVTVRPYVGE